MTRHRISRQASQAGNSRQLHSLTGKCASLIIFLTTLIGYQLHAYHESPPAVPYTVAPSPWNIHLRGAHRAVVEVTESVSVVKANLPWRRRDSNPQNKNVVVVDATTGNVISNRMALNVTKESGTVVFEPQTVPGEYYIYYLPHHDSQNIGYYSGGYVSYSDTSSGSWRATNNLPASAASKPAATLLRFEARLPIDSFWPMEVPVTAAELTALKAEHTAPFLLFPDNGLHPAKMRDELPYRWQTGPPSTYTGSALSDESYSFQICLYASTQDIHDVQLTLPDLVPTAGGTVIPSTALTCINLGGTNWDGDPLIKDVDVTQGRVQPLWVTVKVPAGAAAGDYTGQFTVSSSNAPSQTLDVTLTVGAGVAVNHGYNDPENHSRLAWMDSQLGVSDELIAPYTAMTLADQTVGVLGRTLTIGSDGLPASIAAGTTEILSGPATFEVTQGGSPMSFTGGMPIATRLNDGAVEWQSTSTAGGITMRTEARMEFDGHVNFKVALSSPSAASLNNVALTLPLTAAASSHMAGMGHEGGARPANFNWSWVGPWDSLWLGGPKAGVHCEFRGGSYHGPMINLYHPAPPTTWGGGSVTVQSDGGGAVLRATTGSEQLTAAEEKVFEFSLLITPVKPFDPVLHFGDRYHHRADIPDPHPDWKAWGVNVINVHHSNAPNPFINWPFATPDATKGFIDTYQAQGAKVKLYYTVRELTQYAAEIWALRSLGQEVLDGGSGGGFPWLREHFISDYDPQWYMPVVGGHYDASTRTTRDSRWYNYYVEGLKWLSDEFKIDGLYLDDVTYDRRTLKRIRRVMLDSRPGSRIDLHSNTQFSIGPINQYCEYLPYLDRIWFGEHMDYKNMNADEWLVRTSGVPFGVGGQMLQYSPGSGNNPWLATVFGMCSRWYWDIDPRPVWRLWDDFDGLQDATMMGWWEDSPPITSSDPEVKVTCFVKDGRTLVAVGNFSSSAKNVTLTVNWAALGIDSTKADFFAPASTGFQSQAVFQPGDTIPVGAKRGWVFILDEEDNLTATRSAKARYLLSEGSGATAVDETGNFDGTYVGAITHESDAPPSGQSDLGSVELSGAEWVELPSALADEVFRTGKPWTISFWVRPTVPATSTHNAIFSWMNTSGDTKGILFYLENNGVLDYWIGDDNDWNGFPNHNPGGGLQDAWVHVAAVLDGLKMRCYRNGVLVLTTPIATFLTPDAGRPITLGLRPGVTPSLDLKGKLSDVRIYTGVLNDQEIGQLYTYPGWPTPVDASANQTVPSAFHQISLDHGGGGINLSVPAVATWTYQYEYSDNLSNWSPLGPQQSLPATGNKVEVTDPGPLPDRRFYRLMIE